MFQTNSKPLQAPRRQKAPANLYTYFLGDIIIYIYIYIFVFFYFLAFLMGAVAKFKTNACLSFWTSGEGVKCTKSAEL